MDTKIKTVSQPGKEVIDVKVVEVTADPVVTTYTEQDVDFQIKMATQRLEQGQAELDKWQAIKKQF